MGWASGPGLSAGPTKQGHSVLSELTVNQTNPESENQVPSSEADLVQQD